MFHTIDLRKLAEMTSNDRAFLSIYISGPQSIQKIEKRLESLKKIVKGNHDEHRHMEENMKMVHQYLQNNPMEKGGLCIFCCWLLDYLEAIPLEAPVEDMVMVDSSPFIRPLAELQDEYENFAVVVADNKGARIHLVTSGTAETDEKIRGNVKNHVRVGGWSQQRYERRRDNQMHHYVAEIINRLDEMNKKEEFRRIILVGSWETLKEIHKALPEHLAKQLVGEKPLDLGKSDDFINKEIFELFFQEERKSEKDLWEAIKARHLKGAPAAIGLEEVLEAASIGRIDKMIVSRGAKYQGVRCRDCEGIFPGNPQNCPKCGSDSLFEVDLVNEIVEMLAASGAETDFADPLKELVEIGHVAALLRY